LGGDNNNNMTDFFNKITSATDDTSSIKRSRTNIDNAVNKMGQESDRMMVGNNPNQYHSNSDGPNEENQQNAANSNSSTKVENKTESKKAEDKKTILPQKRILGLKPLHFGLAVVGVAVASYFIYQNYNKTGGAKAVIK